MKNLKRALSFALASVMLLGMMVVGAGAAEFKDADKIENVDAVNTLVALGIIKGKDTGDFDPEGIVTRAEMTKMICVALNNGKDPNLGAGSNFPDAKTHWAGGYIDYCANLGIVAGDTAGNFNPDKTITGTEAAKMLLIALGYNAESEKFVNDANWGTNINVKASQKDLYADVSSLPSAGLTRDNAAQMVWNALQATMVKYDMIGIINGNSVAQAVDIETGKNTLLKKSFDMVTGYSYMTGIEYDSDKSEYTYKLTAAASFGSDAITNDPNNIDMKSTTDYSHLFGLKVKVLYKNNNDKTLYGMYANDSQVLVSDVVGNLPTIAAGDSSFKVDGTSYKLTDNANATPIYAFNEAAATGKFLNAPDAAYAAYAYDLVDNTGDGKGDLVIIYPIEVAKITFVGKDSITAGGKSYKFDDCDIYDGVKKDDYAVITAAKNTANDTVVVAKADVIDGTVGAIRNSDEYRVDGTWYTEASGAGISITAGDTVEMAVVNGYIYYAKVTEGTATLSNVLYVVASKNTATSDSDQLIGESLGGTYKGEDHLVLKADGTKETVKAMRVDVMKDATGGTDVEVKTEAMPGLYTYKVNKDGVYELKAVKAATSTPNNNNDAYYVLAAANLPSSTTFQTEKAAGWDKDDGKLDGRFIADDAVIYLDTQGDGTTVKKDQKVISGKDLKSLGDFGTNTAYLYKSVSGLPTVQVAYITGTAKIPGTSTSDGYGYVTADGYAEKNADDEWVVKFTVWNGTEDVELTVTDADNTDVSDSRFSKGSFVKYVNTSITDEVTDVVDLLGDGTNTLANGAQTAITGWDGDKNIVFDTTNTAEFKDKDETVVIYVNTADKKGIEGASIEIAQELASGVFVKNAVAMTDGGEVVVLFVDTANKLAGAEYTLALTGTTATDNTTTFTPSVAPAAGTVKEGTTLTVTVTTSVAPVKAGGASVVVNLTGADGTVTSQTATFAEGALAGTTATVSFTMPAQNATIALGAAT